MTQTPTQLVNGAAAGDGTGMYLFGGADGRGLYVVGRGGNQPGVQSYSYAGDGVSGVALPYGCSASGPGAIGVFGAATGTRGVGVYATAPSRTRPPCRSTVGWCSAPPAGSPCRPAPRPARSRA